HLLGGDRLVRCAWRLHLAALGMVGSGARVGSTTNEMAISLASAVRVPAHHRRFSLHGFDVAAPDCMAVDQIGRSNAYYPVDLAGAFRRRVRLRTFSSRVARDSRFGSRLSARAA